MFKRLEGLNETLSLGELGVRLADSVAHLFEFVVPMVPPSWNDRARVTEHAERLATSSRPTAVAVSLLDVCEPATDDGAGDVLRTGR